MARSELALMAPALIAHLSIAHPLMARDREPAFDGKNSESTFPDEPTSDEPTSTRATSASTIKPEEKEKPRHSDSGGRMAGKSCCSWMTGKSWMGGRMAGWRADALGGQSSCFHRFVAGGKLIDAMKMMCLAI